MVTALDLPAAALDESERSFVDKVRQHGWFCTGVLEEPKKPGFSYSTGFWNKAGQPELVIFGLTNEIAHQVLWGVFKNIQSGQTLPVGKPSDAVFEGSVAYTFPIAKRHYPAYLGWSRWFYNGNGFPCSQIVWPDRKELFPWQPGFEDRFRNTQPDLTVC